MNLKGKKVSKSKIEASSRKDETFSTVSFEIEKPFAPVPAPDQGMTGLQGGIQKVPR